jgi:transposase-like protein
MKSFAPDTKTHEAKTQVYCPLCTHTVQAMVTYSGKHAKVTPGQKCAHCGSSIDAGFVFRYDRAA